MTERLHELGTARAVVEALGGEEAVGKMCGVTFKAVNNWSNWNEFPAIYYARMMWELNQRNLTAAPRLWRQAACEGLKIRRVSK